ncbi:flagellar hook-basal body complex protein FliE [Pseudalkalibacillus caeni]|uniref:Flagellar hook-basal body complex protein FliE n=1 Tax=Exobacillus caeni TaxID=2574798 RepID=A0A5R9EZH2_9BACL|nr:flagellar hook-basal body complex protein FliE [Pseudalkalibacillus caeni]TLS36732.1 flagellar hook-basal body complex protein FliE [Pseudalkalibacillus caeni]
MINKVQQSLLPGQTKDISNVQNNASANFGDMLKNAINQVNDTQKESDLMTNKLVTGEVQDVHQVMIAAQKASIALNMTVQVRNKVIESYQEIMRMQM